MSSSPLSDSIISTCRSQWQKAGSAPVILAISGGADSTALLLAFRLAGLTFEAAHCNFNLRGEESLRDKLFVESLCGSFGVPLHIRDFNMEEEIRKGESLEMACRRVRYAFFGSLMEKKGFSRIVTAHNADDNVETFFLNAFRGSGSRGLKGMVTDNGQILRPLLGFRKEELVEFLKQNSQPFVTDSSNLVSECYRRNFLRNDVIPLLESKWEGFNKALSQTIRLLGKENKILEHFIARELEGAYDFLSWNQISEFPDPETLIFYFIRQFGGTPVIAEEIFRSFSICSTPGKKWSLNDDTAALLTKSGIMIIKSPSAAKLVGWKYAWKELENSEDVMKAVLSASLDEIYLDCGQENFEWGFADNQMKIQSLGMQGRQSVWKVLKDADIPALRRDSYPILLEKSTREPVWIPGIKRSRLHLVSPSTPRLFHLSRAKGNDD